MKRHHSLSFTAEGEGRIDAVAAREQDIPRSVFSSDSVSIELYGENDKDGEEGFKAMSALKVGDKVTINGWLGNHNGNYQIIACHPTAAAE